MGDETRANPPDPLELAAEEGPVDGRSDAPQGGADRDAPTGSTRQDDSRSTGRSGPRASAAGDTGDPDRAEPSEPSETSSSGSSGTARKPRKATSGSGTTKKASAGEKTTKKSSSTKKADKTATGSPTARGEPADVGGEAGDAGETSSSGRTSSSSKGRSSSKGSSSGKSTSRKKTSRATQAAAASDKEAADTGGQDLGDHPRDADSAGAGTDEVEVGVSSSTGSGGREASRTTSETTGKSAKRRTTRKRTSSRSRRTGITVGVTGAASGIGLAFVRHLVQSQRQNGEIKRVLALDERRGDVDGADWRVLDIRDPSIKQRISGCDVVVHLDLDRSPDSEPRVRSSRNVRGAQTVLTAAAAAGVPRVVLCTSAMVYGALPENPIPLDEDGSLRARPEGVVADMLEVEWLARRAPRAHPGLSVTVVRPGTIVGPGIDTFLTRHFEAPRLLVTRGSQPAWQFCHLEDLVSALEWAASGRVQGSVTCASDGYLEQDEVEEIFGAPRLELPQGLALGAAERLHRLGLTPAPATELSYVSHPWVVPSTRLREAGWTAQYGNRDAAETLAAEIEGHSAALGRRIGRPSTTATLGAAGATAALIGTAAVVARKRKRKRQ